MKTSLQVALTFEAIATLAGCSVSPGASGPKLQVTLGRQHSIALKADAAGRLKHKAENDIVGTTITAVLKQTDSTPFAVKGDPTRPYLVVINGFEKPLHFWVLAREKGRKEFVEVHAIEQPVLHGGNHVVKCWESGSRVEEVILYQLALSDEPRR